MIELRWRAITGELPPNAVIRQGGWAVLEMRQEIIGQPMQDSRGALVGKSLGWGAWHPVSLIEAE